MVAESAMSVTQPSSELWLRQACRRATDTAQDAIFFVNNLYERSIECRVGLIVYSGSLLLIISTAETLWRLFPRDMVRCAFP